MTSDAPNNTSLWGQQVTFTATVTAQNETIPTGVVTFYLDTNPLDGPTPSATVTLVGGQASFTPVPRLTLAVGQTTTTHSVIAVYMPDTVSVGLIGSTSPSLTQTVNNYIQLFSATAITASPNNGAIVDPFSSPSAVLNFGTRTLSTGCTAMTAVIAGSPDGVTGGADQHGGFVVDNYLTVNPPAGQYGNNICTGPHSDTFQEGTVLSCFQGVTSDGTPALITQYVPELPITLTGGPLNLAPYGSWVPNTFTMTDFGVVYASTDVYLVVTDCRAVPPLQ